MGAPISVRIPRRISRRRPRKGNDEPVVVSAGKRERQHLDRNHTQQRVPVRVARNLDPARLADSRCGSACSHEIIVMRNSLGTWNRVARTLARQQQFDSWNAAQLFTA